MRELFDEVAGQSPLDPQEAARRGARTPQRKRFYAKADVAEAEGGFAITLDGKPIRTPSGRIITAPCRFLWIERRLAGDFVKQLTHQILLRLVASLSQHKLC